MAEVSSRLNDQRKKADLEIQIQKLFPSNNEDKVARFSSCIHVISYSLHVSPSMTPSNSHFILGFT